MAQPCWAGRCIPKTVAQTLLPGAWQVRELDLAEDLVQDFDAGLEYAEAVRIQRMREQNKQRFFLVE